MSLLELSIENVKVDNDPGAIVVGENVIVKVGVPAIACEQKNKLANSHEKEDECLKCANILLFLNAKLIDGITD